MLVEEPCCVILGVICVYSGSVLEGGLNED